MMNFRFTIFIYFFCAFPWMLGAQCPDCGNGVVNAGETNLSCPGDVPHSATCTSPCAQPTPFETAAGIRQSFDFTGTTTWSTAGLPAGWSFAGAPTPASAGALPIADAYGAKAGLIQPNCSGSCTGTNGFCIGNLANTVAVGGGGSGGKLGANFDGRANTNVNLSYAVLRGQNNPTLVSPNFNMSAVEGFKVQFWLFPSETSCGQSNSWGSCVSNVCYLDFSSDGGTTWSQILIMNLSSSNSDMCLNNTTNTLWLSESSWSRVCLTVFRTSGATGNFYPSATASTAASGIMVNSAYFVASFKFRIRYSQSASCTSGITTTNPGRYLAIDYPVITSGNEMIPCGLSFINMCGYGADNNDDGVGSTATTTTLAYGTTRRGVNQSERAVEIFHSQNASFASQNLSGSNFATNYDLCNAEGGDKQCIDWRSNNNFYTVVYEILSDMEVPTAFPPSVHYYKGTTPASISMTKVTTAGRTPTVGWRYSANRFVSCGSLSDLNPGCNGYSFSCQTPVQMARGFYNLAINSTGQAWSVYGATSCSHFFSGPSFAPIAVPDTLAGAGNYVRCNASNQLVFTGLSRFCSDATGMSGSATLTISGPNSFSEIITSGGDGIAPIVDAGVYTITAATPSSPAQCINCSRSACVTITLAEITACNGLLPVELPEFTALRTGENSALLEWAITSNTDFYLFEIWKKSGGQPFEQTGEIAGTTGQTTFQYQDSEAGENKAEYRLKCIRRDGTYIYSPVREIAPFGQLFITLVPNPAKETTELVYGPGLEVQEIQILSATGQSIRTWKNAAGIKKMELGGIPAGVYFVNILTSAGWQHLRLVKE